MVRIFRNEEPEKNKVRIDGASYYEKLGTRELKLLERFFPKIHFHPVCSDSDHRHKLPLKISEEVDFITQNLGFFKQIILRISNDNRSAILLASEDWFCKGKNYYLVAAFGDEEYIKKVNAAAAAAEEIAQTAPLVDHLWFTLLSLLLIGALALWLLLPICSRPRQSSETVMPINPLAYKLTGRNLKRDQTKEFPIDLLFYHNYECGWQTLREKFPTIERTEIKWREQEAGWDYVYCYLKDGLIYKAKIGLRPYYLDGGLTYKVRIGLRPPSRNGHLSLHDFEKVETF
ncbi:MAG: hypothetical protein HYT03_00195 [Candidatus Harrisonbacteria bacterium]|nr:hypothetical protein [Candidatus Harrisonbacteria bacterium]